MQATHDAPWKGQQKFSLIRLWEDAILFPKVAAIVINHFPKYGTLLLGNALQGLYASKALFWERKRTFITQIDVLGRWQPLKFISCSHPDNETLKKMKIFISGIIFNVASEQVLPPAQSRISSFQNVVANSRLLFLLLIMTKIKSNFFSFSFPLGKDAPVCWQENKAWSAQ